MICKQCGNEFEDGKNFCLKCGAKTGIEKTENIYEEINSTANSLGTLKIKGKLINKKAIVISAILIIIILFSAFYYFGRTKPYNNFMNSASAAMNEENYDNAVTLYDEAKNYKENNEIYNKIALCGILKKSKGDYENANTDMMGKKYLSAIDTFNKVNEQDIKRYKDSQNKIEECKKLYIADNLNTANDDVKNNKFDDATVALNNILKLEVNNVDAKKVKDNVAKAIQNQKDDAAAAAIKAKALAEAKAKTEKEASKLLTVDQAKNILKTYKSAFPEIFNYDKYLYYYTPDDSYVSPRTYSNYSEIRNEYYIFSVSDEDGSEWDSNLCVNKKTGEIYVADPSGIFMTLNERDARTANNH